MERKVGTLIPQIRLLSPYSYFQLLLEATTPASSFPASASCPAAAGGKSATVWRNGSWWELVCLQYHRSCPRAG